MIRRSLPAVLLIAICALPLSARVSQRAPAAAPQPRASEKPVPFHVGETLTYDVSWSSYVTAGTAVTSVREKKPSFGSAAYYIVAEGRPTPLLANLYSLYYKLDTLVDAYTLLSQRGSTYTEEGRRRKYRITAFERTSQTASYEADSATAAKTTIKIPPGTQDALSAFYTLRTITFKPGARIAMPVCDQGAVYRLEAVVDGEDRVTTGIGEVKAWRVRPTLIDAAGRPQGRNLALWISDDPRRLPVKIEAELAVGTFDLTLREVR